MATSRWPGGTGAAREIVQLPKYLHCVHKDLSLIPRTQGLKNCQVCVWQPSVNPALGRQSIAEPCSLWTAGVAYLASSKPVKDPDPTKQSGRVVRWVSGSVGQWVRELAAKPENLSLIPKIQMAK